MSDRKSAVARVLTFPEGLRPTIDFNGVMYSRFLPKPLSIGIQTAEYAEDVGRVAEAVSRGEPVPQGDFFQENLLIRNNVLRCGLRYVELCHQDGSLFDPSEYVRRVPALRLQSPEDRKTQALILNADGLPLGDGFKLEGIYVYRSTRGRGTTTTARKVVETPLHATLISYSISPPTAVEKSGSLKFTYKRKYLGDEIEMPVTKTDPRTSTVVITGETEKTNLVTKEVVIDVKSVTFEDETLPFCEAVISVHHFLPNGPMQAAQESITAHLGVRGNLRRVSCFSSSDLPNPEWGSLDVVNALRKDHNTVLTYYPGESEAGSLSEALFGRDVSGAMHYADESLTALVRATIRGDTTDPTRLLKFL